MKYYIYFWAAKNWGVNSSCHFALPTACHASSVIYKSLDSITKVTNQTLIRGQRRRKLPLYYRQKQRANGQFQIIIEKRAKNNSEMQQQIIWPVIIYLITANRIGCRIFYFRPVWYLKSLLNQPACFRVLPNLEIHSQKWNCDVLSFRIISFLRKIWK